MLQSQLVVENFETIQRNPDQQCGNAEISNWPKTTYYSFSEAMHDTCWLGGTHLVTNTGNCILDAMGQANVEHILTTLPENQGMGLEKRLTV